MSLVLGALASLFSLSATVPQVLRAARTRSVEGVSYASVVLSLATFTLWVVYAFAVADEVQIVNNVIAFALLVALAVVVVRAGGARTSWVAVVAVLVSAAVAVVTVDVLNSFVLAMSATTVSSVRMVPQTRLALARVPMRGLDPWGAVLGWTGMLLWSLYGAAVGDLGVLLCSVIALVMQSAIVAVRLPPRSTLHAVAGGRLGRPAAVVAAPLARRFPAALAEDYELAA
ncbi:MAG: SemiSWEET family sugar transporter [Nocardioidaceae bacterium]